MLENCMQAFESFVQRCPKVAHPPTHPIHPRGNPGSNPKSISHGCHLREVTFVHELTNETIHLPLGCLQDGAPAQSEAILTMAVKHAAQVAPEQWRFHRKRFSV